jgi:hypothetical protein
MHMSPSEDPPGVSGRLAGRKSGVPVVAARKPLRNRGRADIFSETTEIASGFWFEESEFIECSGGSCRN